MRFICEQDKKLSAAMHANRARAHAGHAAASAAKVKAAKASNTNTDGDEVRQFDVNSMSIRFKMIRFNSI